jgi:hypothetical protein
VFDIRSTTSRLPAWHASSLYRSSRTPPLGLALASASPTL